MNVAELKAKQKLLKSWKYEWKPLFRGYTDKTLYVNVSTNEIKEKAVPAAMKEKFIGGKGYGLRLLWNATTPTTKWTDLENEIIIASGPVAGITQYSGTGKSILVTISPQTDSIMDSNVGGFFGPFLKFAGFDALELQGKADKDVIIYIDAKNHTVEIFEVSPATGLALSTTGSALASQSVSGYVSGNPIQGSLTVNGQAGKLYTIRVSKTGGGALTGNGGFHTIFKQN